MKSLRDVEYVGWGFFSAMLALLAGPGIYVSFYFTYSIMPMAGRVVLGLVLASVVAALVSFTVNELLHRRNLREFEKKRHEERKEKKKHKKRGK